MRIHLSIVILLAAILLCGCTAIDRKPEATTQTPEMLIPVTFPVAVSGNYALCPKSGSTLLPAQIGQAGTASAMIPASLVDQPKFSLRKTRRPLNAFPSFRWEDDGKTTLSLYEGERLVLKYNYGVIPPPQGAPANRARSSYFHPLMGLDGEILTQDYPVDHYHHRGFFYAWTGIFLQGKRLDMWEIQGLWNRCEEITELQTGPVYASLTLRNGWYTEDRKVMTEIMELQVWHSDPFGQALDTRFTWIPLEPIQLGPKDYKGYGGLNIRFPERKNTVVTNIEGIQAKDSDLKRSPWADFSGQFEGRNTLSGITIVNHPQNIDPNPGWIYRVSDTYGFIGVSWPGAEKFDFIPDRSYSNAYRLWIHRGDLKQSNAQRLIDSYLNPPQIGIAP